MDAGTGAKITKSTSTENKMMSYFFRAGYILKNRYLLTATLRADGLKRICQEQQMGIFPIGCSRMDHERRKLYAQH